jgi:hypothetical protein
MPREKRADLLNLDDVELISFLTMLLRWNLVALKD